MSGMLRIRLDLGYDGTNFAGWAKQPGQRTVQGELEDGLSQVARVPIQITVAGRTDAGVHARGQVVHFDVSPDAWATLPGRSDRSAEQALIDRLAGVLPSDLVINAASLAPPGFDARFSALSRTYQYQIADKIADRDPLTRQRVLWHRRPLDVNAMHQSMQPLIGLHDFAAFCRPRPGATTIREVQEITWQRVPIPLFTDSVPAYSSFCGRDSGAQNPGAAHSLIIGTITADAFCHNLVRALVGAAIAVGEGRKPIEWPLEVLRSGRREQAAAVAPAHGLTLQYVTYPPDEELAARAEAIRAKRTLPSVAQAIATPRNLE